jgi:hypothetical protein
MNRRTFLVALVSMLLGLLIGGAAMYALAPVKPFQSPPDTDVVFGNLDVAALITRAKPADAKFIATPAGWGGRNRYGYDGYYTALWEGPTNPDAVRDVVFREIESRLQAKGWQVFSRNANALGSGADTSLGQYELGYQPPDYRAGGSVKLFVHCEGRRVAVVLTFHTGYDGPGQ